MNKKDRKLVFAVRVLSSELEGKNELSSFTAGGQSFILVEGDNQRIRKECGVVHRLLEVEAKIIMEKGVGMLQQESLQFVTASEDMTETGQIIEGSRKDLVGKSNGVRFRGSWRERGFRPRGALQDAKSRTKAEARQGFKLRKAKRGALQGQILLPFTGRPEESIGGPRWFGQDSGNGHVESCKSVRPGCFSTCADGDSEGAQ